VDEPARIDARAERHRHRRRHRGGASHRFPTAHRRGELFLQKEAAPAETDSLQISVHRKLTDGVPLVLTTRVSLEVAGKAREVTLGRSLPAGFEASALESELPARIRDDGRLRVQVRPGSFTITLTARGAGTLGRGSFKVTRPRPTGRGKRAKRCGCSRRRPTCASRRSRARRRRPAADVAARRVEALPAYVLALGATLTLEERQRGDALPAPDELKLSRRLWLDFDGGGFHGRGSADGPLPPELAPQHGPIGEARSRHGRRRRPVHHAVAGRRRRRRGAAGPREPRDREPHRGRAARVPRRGLGARLPGRRGDPRVAARLAPPARDGRRFGERDVARRLDAARSFPRARVRARGGQAARRARRRAHARALGLSVTEPEAPQWLWLAVLLGEALARALATSKLARYVRFYQLGIFVALVLFAVPFAVRRCASGCSRAGRDGS
jgi:hypothetical protein